MSAPNPYNAAFSVIAGSPMVKPYIRLIVLLSLMSPPAGVLAETGSGEEVRERLRAFGQVCRAGPPCPGPGVDPAISPEGVHWEAKDSATSTEEDLSSTTALSSWVTTDIGWPETTASIAIAADASVIMRFTHLDLADGQTSRYGRWENHWVTFVVGEREQDFVARKPTDGREVLLLGRGPGAFLAKAVEENAGDTLLVELQYRRQGPTTFSYSLRGAARALHHIGLADEPTNAAIGAIVDDTVAAETPAPQPFARSGEVVYNAFCFACHATAINEAPLFGSLEQWQPRIDKGMETLVAASLAGFDLMPPMGACIDCTENEMRNAIQYMIDTAR